MPKPVFWIVQPRTELSRRWEYLLMREGWAVRAETALPGFTASAAESRVGIALVDYGLLRPQAAESVRRIKEGASGVSMILTSAPTLEAERVIEVLEAGADDHFTYAVDDKLLLAKLKAHLRRVLPNLASALDVLKSPDGSVKLDRSRQEAWSKSGKEWALIEGLTPTEFQFLALFLERPGKVLERRYIVDALWSAEAESIRPGTVDKHIESLRKKLGKLGPRIRTVYGIGYAFKDAL